MFGEEEEGSGLKTTTEALTEERGARGSKRNRNKNKYKRQQRKKSRSAVNRDKREKIAIGDVDKGMGVCLTVISQAPGTGLGAAGDITLSLTLLAGPPALILGDRGEVCGASTVLGGGVDGCLCKVYEFEPGLNLRILSKGSAVQGRVGACSYSLVGLAAGGSRSSALLEIVSSVRKDDGEGEGEGKERGEDLNHDG